MKITVWIVSASNEPFVTTVEVDAIAAKTKAAPGSVVLTSHEIETPPIGWETPAAQNSAFHARGMALHAEGDAARSELASETQP